MSQIATQSLRFHRQTMHPAYVDPKELIQSVLDLYRGRLANSNIRVDFKLMSTKRIQCFENDIRQVLNNLLANAVDAMRQGGRLVLCSRDGTDWRTGRSGVRITVADNGHGMSAMVRKRLFEPFYTTKEMRGTGLGLWISREIVARTVDRWRSRAARSQAGTEPDFAVFARRRKLLNANAITACGSDFNVRASDFVCSTPLKPGSGLNGPPAKP